MTAVVIAGLRPGAILGRAALFFACGIPLLGLFFKSLDRLNPVNVVLLPVLAGGVLWLWREAFWLSYGALFRRRTALRTERSRLVFIHSFYSSRLLAEITSVVLPPGGLAIEIETGPKRRQMHIPTQFLDRAKTTVLREVRAAVKGASA